jgi:predicted RNase H-like nuclease (RuvC/YqgF family)
MDSKPKKVESTDARLSVLENNMNILNHNLEKLEYQTDQNYATLHSRISDLRDDLRKDFELKNDKIIAKLEEHNNHEQSQNKILNQKISHIEKWRWMIMGGALVIGYILAHVKLENIL